MDRRLLVQLTASFEDRFREWRRATPDKAFNGDAIVDFMTGQVDSARARLFGKQAVLRTKVESAERSASGHVDYEHKLALYCTELVLEV